MKTVIKIVTAILAVPFFILLLLTSFVRFELLNENFWFKQYRSPGFKKTLEVRTQEFANAFVKEQLKKQGIQTSELESAFVEQEVSEFTQSLSVDKVETFLEKNTSNVLNLVNGNTNNLIFYAPLEDFGIDTASGVLDDLQISENEFEVSRLLSNPSSPGIFDSVFTYLQSVGRLSTILFASVAALLSVLLYIYYSISQKLESLGKLLIVLGILGFILVVPLRVVLSRPDVFSAVGSSEPAEVATSLFIPLLLSGFVSYAMFFSAGTAVFGLAAYFSDKLLMREK